MHVFLTVLRKKRELKQLALLGSRFQILALQESRFQKRLKTALFLQLFQLSNQITYDELFSTCFFL